MARRLDTYSREEPGKLAWRGVQFGRQARPVLFQGAGKLTPRKPKPLSGRLHLSAREIKTRGPRPSRLQFRHRPSALMTENTLSIVLKATNSIHDKYHMVHFHEEWSNVHLRNGRTST